MKHLTLIALLILSAVPQFAFANKIIGNGAMVVVCGSGSGEEPVRLLDIYETEDIYSAPFLPPLTLSNPAGDDYKAKFHSLVSRISERFPDLSRQILDEFANFTAHTAYKKNKKLPDTADDYHSDLPIGCELKQLAVQREPMFLRKPWFSIAAEYWDKMDEFNKAAAVLHETVYRIGVKNGLEHSLGVRYLVGLLIANEIETIGDQDWIDAFTQSRIRNFEIGTLKIPLFTGQFVPCKPSPGTVVCSRTENLKVATLRYNFDRRIQQVTYDDGEERIEFAAIGNIHGSLRTKEVRFDWSRREVELVSNGFLSLSSPEAHMNFLFKGRVTPSEGLISGTQTLMVGRDRNVDSMEFEGTIAQIVGRYGILNSAYYPAGYRPVNNVLSNDIRPSNVSGITQP